MYMDDKTSACWIEYNQYQINLVPNQGPRTLKIFKLGTETGTKKFKNLKARYITRNLKAFIPGRSLYQTLLVWTNKLMIEGRNWNENKVAENLGNQELKPGISWLMHFNFSFGCILMLTSPSLGLRRSDN